MNTRSMNNDEQMNNTNQQFPFGHQQNNMIPNQQMPIGQQNNMIAQQSQNQNPSFNSQQFQGLTAERNAILNNNPNLQFDGKQFTNTSFQNNNNQDNRAINEGQSSDNNAFARQVETTLPNGQQINQLGNIQQQFLQNNTSQRAVPIVHPQQLQNFQQPIVPMQAIPQPNMVAQGIPQANMAVQNVQQTNNMMMQAIPQTGVPLQTPQQPNMVPQNIQPNANSVFQRLQNPQMNLQALQQQLPVLSNDVFTSNCTGNKKALLIGINYIGTPNELQGCINDVNNVKNFLLRCGFRIENMIILTDDQKDPNLLPTKANIIKAMQWLVYCARPNDSLFCHYSGHGVQIPDVNGDEKDGDDEALAPMDFKTQGFIIDDDLYKTLVLPLCRGVRLTFLSDCCHSGTILDLAFVYDGTSTLTTYKPIKTTTNPNKKLGLLAFLNMFNGTQNNQQQLEYQRVDADVVVFSGCKDDQTSADTQMEGKATGAMSYAFITTLNRYPYGISYAQLLNGIRNTLKGKYSQEPLMSTCRAINPNSKFMI